MAWFIILIQLGFLALEKIQIEAWVTMDVAWNMNISKLTYDKSDKAGSYYWNNIQEFQEQKNDSAITLTFCYYTLPLREAYATKLKI